MPSLFCWQFVVSTTAVHGTVVATGFSGMRRERHALDRHPGTLPDIRTDDGNIIYTMMPVGPRGEQLIIRCDADGEVWISVRPVAPSVS